MWLRCCGLGPTNTMIVVVSKTFTTQETIANARCQVWLKRGEDEPNSLRSPPIWKEPRLRHFEQTRLENGSAGATPCGDRSAVHCPVYWVGTFKASWRCPRVDNTCDTPLKRIPVFSRPFGHWNQNALGFRPTLCSLRRRPWSLPAYLQQADMESNGKFVGRDGKPVSWNTGGGVGRTGTNSQYAFFQLLHQGTEIHPVDFVAFKAPTSEHEGMHRMLLANALAQAEALLKGARPWKAPPFFPETGSTFSCSTPCLPNPWACLSLSRTPHFVQGVLWGIQADQWGSNWAKPWPMPCSQKLEGSSEVSHDARPLLGWCLAFSDLQQGRGLAWRDFS